MKTARQLGLDSAILVNAMYIGQLVMALLLGPLIAFYGSPVISFLVSSITAFAGTIVALFAVDYGIN